MTFNIVIPEWATIAFATSCVMFVTTFLCSVSYGMCLRLLKKKHALWVVPFVLTFRKYGLSFTEYQMIRLRNKVFAEDSATAKRFAEIWTAGTNLHPNTLAQQENMDADIRSLRVYDVWASDGEEVVRSEDAPNA